MGVGRKHKICLRESMGVSGKGGRKSTSPSYAISGDTAEKAKWGKKRGWDLNKNKIGRDS